MLENRPVFKREVTEPLVRYLVGVAVTANDVLLFTISSTVFKS